MEEVSVFPKPSKIIITQTVRYSSVSFLKLFESSSTANQVVVYTICARIFEYFVDLRHQTWHAHRPLCLATQYTSPWAVISIPTHISDISSHVTWMLHLHCILMRTLAKRICIWILHSCNLFRILISNFWKEYRFCKKVQGSNIIYNTCIVLKSSTCHKRS